MSHEEVFRTLHEVGCCNGCCARLIGLRNPASYANIDSLALKYLAKSQNGSEEKTKEAEEVSSNGHTNGSGRSTEGGGPSAKRVRREPCSCCVGVLQRHLWSEATELVTGSLKEKNYECDNFACGLSSPVCIPLREKSLQFYLESKIVGYKQENITPLKEAWKWMFGPVLAAAIDKTLDSGATCPLLISITIDYDNDYDEVHCIRDNDAPRHTQLSERSRRSVLDQVATVTATVLAARYGVPPPAAGVARCVSVRTEHSPLYIAGRYIKLSRELSQTPWIIDGQRIMESSVQDIMFGPIAKYYRIGALEAEQRLKLITAGREDVDVRCLGTGRPFVVEVTDPFRTPTANDLEKISQEISESKLVVVKTLRMCIREELNQLKKGEEFKEKSYRALCIKLPDKIDEESKDNPTVFTDEDLHKLKTYTDGDATCRFKVQQKTPLRVLHRRTLLTRERRILHMDAEKVPGHPNLFMLDLHTEAGTYVKELVHGDLGRSRPCLRDVLSARVDILALDVTRVHLDW